MAGQRHAQNMEPIAPESPPNAAPEVAPTPEASGADKPASMLDAMFGKPETAGNPETVEAKAERLRDEAGRFAKAEAKPEDPAAVKVEQKKPADPNAMPEGLKPESQQRFQQLATQNKELTARAEQAESQVTYLREAFQANGITQRQFEQATQFLGAINRGELDSALQIIDAQRSQLALAMGKPLPGVDPLADFPDLRQEVDAAQMSEARALEIARYRVGQHAQIQADHQHRQQQQSRQQVETEQREGLMGIDQFCKQMQSSDLDYEAIEAKLLPRIRSITEGVPPKYWAAKVREAYELIKETASARAPTAATPLRPTGGTSASAAPKTMFEAMWAKPA